MGYNHIASNIKDIKGGVKKLETQQNINTNSITNIKYKIKDVRPTLTSLDGHTYYGKCVLYRNEPKAEDDKIKLLEQVNLMTPENIHFNSFMYEPILDMSDEHLRQLYVNLDEMLSESQQTNA